MYRSYFSLSLSAVQGAGGQLEEALESTTDAQEWRLEVERVLPALKIHVRQDNRVRL
jgi:estrogen-related receptor beta like 1